MKFIGNYLNIIRDDWITYLTDNDGTLCPDSRECFGETFSEQVSEIHKIFRPINFPRWQNFGVDEIPFSIPWPVPLSERIEQVVIKQLPGQLMAMHVDENPIDSTNRYILMLTDYHPGHILLWGDVLFRDYKKGDLCEIQNINAPHGAANFSNYNRIAAYLTVWN
jgi:hypothetical protein